MDMNHFKLQFITHFTDTYSYLDSARMALEGGCRWVQLRMKHAPTKRRKPWPWRYRNCAARMGLPSSSTIGWNWCAS